MEKETKLYFTNLVGETIDRLADEIKAEDVVVIADVNTAQFVLPVLRNDSRTVAGARLLTIKAGEEGKTIDETIRTWRELQKMEATRSTLVINLGGGVVTDLGGFVAATFKRGMRFINVPTTVLGAVDASYGGKTGINFGEFKNQIGVFADPYASVISSIFFNTLPKQQILSGYAEMLKHGVLMDADTLAALLRYSPVYPVFDSEGILPLIEKSSKVKQDVVREDPREAGRRKILNLGHTAGHAIEAFGYRHGNPVPHGYAVAWGLVISLVLSHLKLGFPSETLHKVADYIYTNYGTFPLSCDDYPELLASMRQDKKNLHPGVIAFTLMKDVGVPQTDVEVPDDDITAAIDIFRDLMHQS